jgi:hypothetical protein
MEQSLKNPSLVADESHAIQKAVVRRSALVPDHLLKVEADRDQSDKHDDR